MMAASFWPVGPGWETIQCDRCGAWFPRQVGSGQTRCVLCSPRPAVKALRRKIRE